MRLTARKLELFDKPGKGAAANAISAAVTIATRDAIRTIGKRYDRGRAANAIYAAFRTTVMPVLTRFIDLGACDSEPRRAVNSEFANRISKRYGLDCSENDDLYYML